MFDAPIRAFELTVKLRDRRVQRRIERGKIADGPVEPAIQAARQRADRVVGSGDSLVQLGQLLLLRKILAGMFDDVLGLGAVADLAQRVALLQQVREFFGG